jgi:hypothetical protein
MGTQPFGRNKKTFSHNLSNSGCPFDYIVKAGQPGRRTPLQEEYLAHSQEEKMHEEN